ncbi:MAG: CinA family protein, partial [Chloroflexota bacterium]
AITEVPGSSAYYRGGIVCYSNDAKIELLGISPATIGRHGAVSAQVAKAMAISVRDKVGVAFSVAVTGVAGPDGGSPRKPVGLTYVAVTGPHGSRVQRYLWGADRSGNKYLSAAAAMDLLVEVIEASENDGPVR